eukprot:6996916-Prorocentrum_lima.AAC.1
MAGDLGWRAQRGARPEAARLRPSSPPQSDEAPSAPAAVPVPAAPRPPPRPPLRLLPDRRCLRR